jgi:NUMOD3 motif
MNAASPFYVYAFFRPDGTPCYVGKGKGQRLRHDGNRNQHLMRIIRNAKSAGTPIIRMKLAENLTDPQAIQLEKDLIRLVGRVANGGPLVNLTDGGDGASGYRYTDEQREQARQRRKNFQHSDESRAAISAALKGRPKSPTHIAAAAAAQRGSKKSTGWWSTEEGRAKQRANNRGNTGNHHSEETREIIRRASIRQFASAKARRAVRTSSAWADRNSIRYRPLAA